MLLAAMLGAFGRGVVTVSGESVTSQNPAGAVAAIRFNMDGTVERGIDGGFVQVDEATDWIRPTHFASALYEIRATVNSGALSSGTVDTWLSMDDNRTFSCVATPGNRQQANITIEIRFGGTVLSSGVYPLDADAR